MNFSGCLKAVSKWIGCHIAFSSLDIKAILDPLQKLNCLSNNSVVGWLCLLFSPPRMSDAGWDARFLMIITQSVTSANIPPWPLATEVNSGEFWITSSVFPTSEKWISWHQLGHVPCAAAGLHMCCCEMWNQSTARPPLRSTGYKS